MMEGPRHQHLHQEWQEPLEEPCGAPPPTQRPRGFLHQVELPKPLSQLKKYDGSSRRQVKSNKRNCHLVKRGAQYVSAGAHPALPSRGGMSVRARRFGRGTRQSHYSLSFL